MTPACRISYPAPPLDERMALRFAGCREESEEMLALLRGAYREAEARLTYTVALREMPLEILGDECRYGGRVTRSASLARHLSGCERVVLFAATLGLDFDRLLSRESRLSPARALILQGLGAERIESLCDCFCRELEERMAGEGFSCRTRFSPGYGDLPLSAQGPIFSLLSCEKLIGLTLTGSGLMSPTKSVTAFVGIYEE